MASLVPSNIPLMLGIKRRNGENLLSGFLQFTKPIPTFHQIWYVSYVTHEYVLIYVCTTK